MKQAITGMALTAAALLWAGGASAATNEWTGPANDVWGTSTSWSLGTPGATDDVLLSGIGIGREDFVLDAPATVNSVTLNNDNVNSQFNIRDTLAITSGRIASAGARGGSIAVQQTSAAKAATVLAASDIAPHNTFVVAADSGQTAYWTLQAGQAVANSFSTFVGQINQPRSGVLTLGSGATLHNGQWLTLNSFDNGTLAGSSSFILDGGTLSARFGIQRGGNTGANGGEVYFGFNSGTIENGTVESSVIKSGVAGATLDIALGDGGTAASREIFVNAAARNITQESTARFVNQDGAAGSFRKAGAGKLILQGENTYTGDTIVGAGTLQLDPSGSLVFKIGADGANNTLYDDAGADAKLTLDGTFVFDLSDADATVGNAWLLVDRASFDGASQFFGSTFSVAGFADAGGGRWTKDIDGTDHYRFDEGTGYLTVIPEPATIGLVVSMAGVLALVRRLFP